MPKRYRVRSGTVKKNILKQNHTTRCKRTHTQTQTGPGITVTHNHTGTPTPYNHNHKHHRNEYLSKKKRNESTQNEMKRNEMKQTNKQKNKNFSSQPNKQTNKQEVVIYYIYTRWLFATGNCYENNYMTWDDLSVPLCGCVWERERERKKERKKEREKKHEPNQPIDTSPHRAQGTHNN